MAFCKGYPRRETYVCRGCSAQWSEVAPTMRMNGSECPQCGRWHVYESFFHSPSQKGEKRFVSDIRPWKTLEAWARIAPSEAEIQVAMEDLRGKEGHELSFIVEEYTRRNKCLTSRELARSIAADRLAKDYYNATWYATIRGPYIET